MQRETMKEEGNKEGKEEMWGPFGCRPCPLRACSGLLFLFFPPPYNLPGILGILLPPPGSCHGDGNLDPVESSLLGNEAAAPCLPPACLCVGGQLQLLPDLGPARPLCGDPALPPQNLGWRPWCDWLQRPSENI